MSFGMIYPRGHGHVITLIHLDDGRATVDCRCGFFWMNLPDEAAAGRVIASHRLEYLSPSTLGESDG